jgi:inorganic triphosphatase YgiF
MQEIEAALVIVDRQPQRIMLELAALTALGECVLRPAGVKAIHDTYFDRSDGALGARQLSLRARQVNGRARLTLKGGTEAVAGLKVRRELELDDTPEALAAIRAELASEGVSIPCPQAQDEAQLGGVEAFRVWGLVVIQERRTERTLCDVIAPEGEAIAEMSLDAVTFRFGEIVVRHYEIEIELRAGVAAQRARELATLLYARFPESLRPWTVAKLTLGMWLERLQAEGKLARYLRADGTLAPEIYQAMSRSLA